MNSSNPAVTFHPRLPVRRSLAQLQQRLAKASAPRAKAMAAFHLAVFHDNNGRELRAIPFYRQAIRLGLPTTRRPQAMAWLASSLMKTGQLHAAWRSSTTALRIVRSPDLRRFLLRLQHRIAQMQRASR